MKIPSISVLMPVHGQAPYLHQAIESVLAQSKKDFELIVVFDRPNQDTIRVVEEYQSQDNRLRSLYSTEPGISAALNLGISASNAALIARLDSDDVMSEDRLMKQELAMQNKNIVCVGSQLRIVDQNGRMLRYTHYPTRPFSIKSSLRIRNVIAHPSVMYRKASVELSGGYRTEFNGAEDYDLWIRLSRIGKIVNLGQPLTNYRTHENQYSSKNKAIQTGLDARVRLSNFSKLSERPALYSASIINDAINSSSLKRISLMGLATFLNPLMAVSFLFLQVVPEVFAHDK